MCFPARTEALLYHKFRNENILTSRAGIALVVTFHTSPPGWRRHLGEVFSDHLNHGTLFLLGSVCASSATTCATDHPESSVRSAALSRRSAFRVSSMYEVSREAAAALRFYRLSRSGACVGGAIRYVGGASRFRQERSRFAAHAIQARVTPLIGNMSAVKTHTLSFIITNTHLYIGFRLGIVLKPSGNGLRLFFLRPLIIVTEKYRKVNL